MTRYELLDRIGVGGMAEIFRGKAVAAGGFEKPVAIKRILPHLSQDRRFVELLIAEAKVLSLLKHRNIVQIFDVGVGDDGKYFLVMEYVDGADLRAVQAGLEARRRRVPYDLALHIGAEICEALEHAHTARAPDGKPMSLVHRDVSPSNVLLSRSGEVKLTDFGIAKRAEQETQHGAVRGKFAYISPEQARNEPLGPRSDVFSVAILLWELMCARRLFSGLGDLEALRAVREAAAPRVREIDAHLPAEIDVLLANALSRDPSKRPTAGQFATQLRSLRYALETTVGDPAAELARMIDDAVTPARPTAPPPRGFDSGDPSEATVFRIRTADDFAARGDGGMARARQIIDQFDDEETRQAELSRDQVAMLRGARSEGSAPRRLTDEQTVARAPLVDDGFASDDDSMRRHGDEQTRLVAPRNHRTPPPLEPQPRNSPSETPTPMLKASLDDNPGTVHGRNAGPGVPPIVAPPAAFGPTVREDQVFHESWATPPGSNEPWTPTADHETPSISRTPEPLPPQPVLPPPPPSPPLRPSEPPWQPMPAPPQHAPLPRPSLAPRPAPRAPTNQRRSIAPWVVIIGAVIIAALAFLITRVLLS